jgi:hypothetical protein
MAVATASLLVACGGESGPNNIDVGSIQVTPNPVALAQQQSVQLQVAAFDDAGALLAGVPVTFTVGDAALITVSSSGLLQSVGPAGTTSVMVKAASRSISVPVSIGATGSTISVLPADASVQQMGTLQLEAKLLDLVGTEIPGVTFTFMSADPSIATVSESGLVTSAGPAGEVNISVTTGGLTTQKTVTVVPTPTSISLSPNPVTLGRSAERPLVATVLDVTGSPVSDPAITYSAQPSSLLAVSGAGVLTSKGTPGTGTVTAAAGTLSVTVPVTILNVGTLAGTISGSVSVAGQPYGVALGAGNAFYGVGSGGSFDVGSFGSTTHTSNYVSAPIMTGVAFSPTNGLVYAAGNTTDGLMEIDPASSTILRRWEAPDQMYDVAISPDGSQIYVAGSPDRLYVISAATMTLVKDLPAGGSVVHLFVDPSHPLVYTSGGSLVREINVATGATRAFDFPGAQATALAIAGDKLFIGGEGETLGVVDLSTGLTTTVSVPCQIYDLVAAPDGVQLLATCSLQGKAVLLDAYTFDVIQTIQTNGTPRRAAIKPDGTGAIIANAAGSYTFVE